MYRSPRHRWRSKKNVAELKGSRFVRTSEALDFKEVNKLPAGYITCKAKSRWVVHGYIDPDVEDMRSSSPVPTTMSLYLALQKSANNDWNITFAGIKTTYLNQPKRKREEGEVYVRLPRDHPDLPGRLCELQKDSYGVICVALK